MKYLPSVEFAVKLIVSLVIINLILDFVGLKTWIYSPLAAFKGSSGTAGG